MTTSSNPAIISGYAFSLEGLKISFTKDRQRTTLSFDPLSTCDILKATGLIEDFTSDKNAEPVILYTDSQEPQGYGYELWYRFIKSFPVTMDLLQSILERRQEL